MGECEQKGFIRFDIVNRSRWSADGQKWQRRNFTKSVKWRRPVLGFRSYQLFTCLFALPLVNNLLRSSFFLIVHSTMAGCLKSEKFDLVAASAGLRFVWTLPNVAAALNGTDSEAFSLPRPFDQTKVVLYVFGGSQVGFYTQDDDLTLPSDLTYKLSVRGKIPGESFALPGDETLADLTDAWIQEDGSLIVDGEITPNLPDYIAVRQRSSEATRNQLMAKAFEEERFADFTLICEGKTIKISKGVVGPQSDFFGKLFETNMKESESGEAEIKNISYDTLKLLVRYLYCGEISGLDVERDVLIAADYLNIENVKKVYNEYASENMSLETIHETLLNAKTFKLELLTQKCLAFLENKNCSSVVKTMVDLLEPFI